MSKHHTFRIPHRFSRGVPRSAQTGAPLASCVKRTTVDQTSNLRLTKHLSVGTWNVRTQCGLGADRILAAELERARVNIMGLQEVRWSDVGESSVASRTILWSGPPEGATRQAGIALVLRKKAAGGFRNWQPGDERILFAW